MELHSRMDLLDFARARTPFYRSAGSDWQALPIVGRKDYVEQSSAFRSEISGDGRIYELKSSGTTGPALTVVLDDDAWSSVNFRFFEQIRVAAGLDNALFQRGQPGVLFVSNKPGRHSFVKVMPSLAHSLYVRMQLPEQVARTRDAYLRFRAPILYGKPSYLLGLRSALMAAGHPIAPWSPALVLVSGESLHNDDRRRLETFFRAPLMDALASTEGGLIAVKAAEDDRYRVVGENVWLEIIDDDGSVHDNGEGELVLTNLIYRQMVFLRYRTGDVADLRTDADSGHQSLLRLRGRVPATLMFGPQSLQTDRVTRAFADMPGLGDFRLTAHPDGAALLQWSPEPCQDIDHMTVTAALRGHLEAWLPGHALTVEPVEALTAKGGKKQRFVQIPPPINPLSTHAGTQAMKPLDLTWTGNQFLDVRSHGEAVLDPSRDTDFTTKEDVWSERLAASIEKHYSLPECFVRVAAGATQLIESILRGHYAGLIVDVTPNFHLTATLALQEGWQYIGVPVREPGELEDALAPYLHRPEAIIIMSSPRNPLGYQFPVDVIERLAQRTSALLVIDEVYADFAPDTAMRLLSACKRVVVVRTFSKAWGLADLRVGFAAGAVLAIEPKRLRLIPNAVSGVSQRAARRLLDDPSRVRTAVRETCEFRDLFAASLSNLPDLRVWPSDANYVCVETPHAGRLAQKLENLGYLVRELHDLKGYPADWPTGLRMTVPTQPHLQAIVDAIRDELESVET